MAMAHNNTPPRKLWLSCGGTRCTLQALIILSTLVLLLAASTADDVVGTAEPQPPSGGGSGDCRHYRFELTHVDANLSLSSDELMRRAYDRSRLRAATLYGTAADSPAAGVGGGSSDSDPDSRSGSPAGSLNLSQVDSVYNIMFYMGNNRRRRDIISAVVDTGSDLIWTTMKECLLSSTKSMVPCSSDMCEQQANKRQCRGTCTYTITYGGDKGTKTEGILYKDKLTFLHPRPQQTFVNRAIGCSTSYTKFKDRSIKGIVGLGRGAQSLPGQLNFNKFSYCLSSYYKPDLPSYLLLTTAPNMATGARSGAAVATTGLRQNDRYKTRYFVDLQGISINGTRLDVATKSGGSAGGGNMFVDTGASCTELDEGVFNFSRLVEKVDQIMKDKQYSKLEQSHGGSICYSSSSTTARPDESMLPQMVLHFARPDESMLPADMVLPWDSYLWYTSTSKSSKLCLAILKSATTGMLVLGNFQMQGIHMLFDTQNDKLLAISRCRA